MKDPIINEQYHCYLEGRYLGVATFVEDKNIGQSFIRLACGNSGIVHLVLTPDRWEAIENNNN